VMVDRLEPGELAARHRGAVELHLVMVCVSPASSLITSVRPSVRRSVGRSVQLPQPHPLDTLTHAAQVHVVISQRSIKASRFRNCRLGYTQRHRHRIFMMSMAIRCRRHVLSYIATSLLCKVHVSYSKRVSQTPLYKRNSRALLDHTV